MKTTLISFASLLAAAAASPTALVGFLTENNPAVGAPPPGNNFCYDFGQPCSKLKRATDFASAALDILSKRDAAASPEARFCWAIGQPCDKAKRAEDALRQAIELVNNYTELPNDFFDKRDPGKFCHDIGQPCGKLTREASPEADPIAHRFCHDIGQPCDKLKRDAGNFCHDIGQPCGKVRRAVAEIEAAYNIAAPVDKRGGFCHDIGQPCDKSKRALDHLKATADKVVKALDD